MAKNDRKEVRLKGRAIETANLVVIVTAGVSFVWFFTNLHKNQLIFGLLLFFSAADAALFAIAITSWRGYNVLAFFKKLLGKRIYQWLVGVKTHRKFTKKTRPVFLADRRESLL